MTWLSQKLKAEAKVSKTVFVSMSATGNCATEKRRKLAFGEMEAQKENSDWPKIGD